MVFVRSENAHWRIPFKPHSRSCANVNPLLICWNDVKEATRRKRRHAVQSGWDACLEHSSRIRP